MLELQFCWSVFDLHYLNVCFGKVQQNKMMMTVAKVFLLLFFTRANQRRLCRNYVYNVIQTLKVPLK